jgi:hypothetical protein
VPARDSGELAVRGRRLAVPVPKANSNSLSDIKNSRHQRIAQEDLDDSICFYRKLSATHRAKFDRAAFWCDVASRQWNTQCPHRSCFWSRQSNR